MPDARNRNERYLFFLNEGSGKGFPEDFKEEITLHMNKRKAEYEIVPLDQSLNKELIRDKIMNYHPTVVVAGGGDGTVNLIAGLIIQKNIRLGIIPLGSSNGLAYQLHIPDRPSRALQLILEGKHKVIDAFRINEDQICFHMCDLGMNASVIKRYEHENIRGMYGYARQYFRELTQRRKFRVRIKNEKQELTLHAIMIVLANGSYYGTGASINPDGRPDDGKFEAIIIHSYPFWFLFYMFLTLFSDKLNKKKFSKVISCKKFEVSVTPPQEMQIDGEYLGKEQTVIARILPACLDVLTG